MEGRKNLFLVDVKGKISGTGSILTEHLGAFSPVRHLNSHLLHPNGNTDVILY